jgi:UDP-N-acetylmuramyl pentapeptide phosphotransferase/UDP-N-acetylglucosamine-1-phosphate transferase
MTLLHMLYLFFSTTLASFAATGLILCILKRRGIVDTPNERSSHKNPTPRGGGLAVILVSLGAWGFSLGDGISAYQGLFIATLILGFVSWVDDVQSLSAMVRLLSQFLAVSLVFWLVPTPNLYFHGILPQWLDSLVAVFIWVWFINLFNFMDGIDGISAVEASTIGLGVFILMALGAVQLTHGLLGLTIAASAIGFIWWNWQPAKVFLGDVGSVPLGFLLGWLLLEILSTTHWPVAVILPLYYLADATITLGRRVWRNERLWRAHREHFYQQATSRGLGHAQVTLLIGGANTLLVGLAVFSVDQPLQALLLAFIIVGGLLLVLRGSKNGNTS